MTRRNPLRGFHGERPGPAPAGGFTLTEVMIVIVLLSLVIIIAVPKFNAAIRNANEGATKGRLGTLRASVNIYFIDNDGNYPSDLTPFMQPGGRYYLTGLLPIYTADHGYTGAVDLVGGFNPAADNGGWGYVNAGPAWGKLWIECTHLDSRGKAWSEY